ncbi:hypothetical protein X777_10833 [Ooceraea biroi]|uniref:Uncharacterized protein n=1 Tax=Ooceraea biroi TaxID=2015173 RepID=A0A026W449_OOCBI|nr:hypothetical protein X777_10833 [Ooceraea biroi]
MCVSSQAITTRCDHWSNVRQNLILSVLKAYSRSHPATRTDINLGGISEVHTAS